MVSLAKSCAPILYFKREQGYIGEEERDCMPRKRTPVSWTQSSSLVLDTCSRMMCRVLLDPNLVAWSFEVVMVSGFIDGKVEWEGWQQEHGTLACLDVRSYGRVSFPDPQMALGRKSRVVCCM